MNKLIDIVKIKKVLLHEDTTVQYAHLACSRLTKRELFFLIELIETYCLKYKYYKIIYRIILLYLVESSFMNKRVLRRLSNYPHFCLQAIPLILDCCFWGFSINKKKVKQLLVYLIHIGRKKMLHCVRRNINTYLYVLKYCDPDVEDIQYIFKYAYRLGDNKASVFYDMLYHWRYSHNMSEAQVTYIKSTLVLEEMADNIYDNSFSIFRRLEWLQKGNDYAGYN